MSNFKNYDKTNVSLQWYFHPNETVRLMRTRVFDNINKDIVLSPNYTSDLKIGVVIGTYGATPYVDLGLHYLKNVNEIDKILVHDDCSPEKDKLKKLCDDYGVDFYSTNENMFHKGCIGSIGDQNCFFEGLKWAKENKLDILIKFSRRLIPCYRWVDDFKKLVLKSDGLTFSSYCERDLFPIRTECMAMNVNAWANEHTMNVFEFFINNKFCTFAEFIMDNIAKQLDFQNYSTKYEEYKKSNKTGFTYSGYVHWYDLLGTCRYNDKNRHSDVLWHMYKSDNEYFKEINKIFPNKYDLNSVKNVTKI
jgi:hypothetical protein